MTPAEHKALGASFASRRRALGLNQRQLAEVMGATNSVTISRKEAGINALTPKDWLVLEALEYRKAIGKLLHGTAAEWNETIRELREIFERNKPIG